MASRPNQGKAYEGQLGKKKSGQLIEEKLPHVVIEDMRDLFMDYDQEKLGVINESQLKSILHYITGGILKRSVLENYISETLSRKTAFEFKEVKRVARKLWKDVGKDRQQHEINRLLSSLTYSNNSELETALKSILNK